LQGPLLTSADDDPRGRLEKLRRFLEKNYGARILKLDRLDRGVYRADREDGKKWVVRVFRDRPLGRVKGDAEILRFLEGHGFPAERCAAPESVTEPGGIPVIVTQWVEGTMPARTEGNLRALGVLLGDLNTLPEGKGAVAREAGALHHYSKGEGPPRNEIGAAVSWLDEVAQTVDAKSRERFESLREQVERADDGDGLPEALIHPDMVLKNVVETSSGLTVIDWTGAGRGPRIGPLALLIWSSALGEGGWSEERVDAVVEGYRSRVALKKEELERLAGVMRVRPLVFACWRYRHAMLSGKQPDGQEWWWPSDELVEEIAGSAVSAFGRPEGR
jgi:Ser/Thr protein kinase RdoA (MazF antagonist)